MTSIVDILGAEAAAGDPDAIGRAAHALAHLADQSASAEARLRSVQAGQWVGAGADAFRARQAGPLPAQLQAIARSCSAAERGLSRYAATLGAIQAHARLLASQRDQAVDELRERSASAASATSRATAASRTAALAIEPAERVRAGAAATKAKAGAVRARAAQAAAEARLRGLDAQAQKLRQEHHDAAAACQGALDSAVGSPGHSDDLLLAVATGGLIALKWGADAFNQVTGWAENTITDLRKGHNPLAKQYIWIQQEVRKITHGSARGGWVERFRTFGKSGGKFVAGISLGFAAADAVGNVQRGRYKDAAVDVLWGGLSVTPPGVVIGVFDFATGGFIPGKQGLISGTFTGFWADVSEDGVDVASNRCRDGEYGPALQFMSGATEYFASYGMDGGDTALRRAESGEFGGALQSFAKGESAVIDAGWKAGESFVGWLGGRR